MDLGLALLSEGLAKLHPSFEPQRVANGEQLATAEAAAREKRLKVRSTACLYRFMAANSRHVHRDAQNDLAARQGLACDRQATQFTALSKHSNPLLDSRLHKAAAQV